MKVLVIGNGGRRACTSLEIGRSPQVLDRVFVAPGNAGTTGVAENVDISSTDIAPLIKFAKQNDIGLTVVGPEQPLTLGIVDAFMTEKLHSLRSQQGRGRVGREQSLLQKPAAPRRRADG